MALSIIRGLTATVFRNLAALKRDAKRLQKHSLHVFGTEYPLSTCQHAIAVSRGFRSLADVEKLGARIGLERDAPFFTIRSRNDTHQEVLEAIYRLELEVSSNGPVVILGQQSQAILPALVMLVEEMSYKKAPGVILVETSAQAVEDTVVYTAITQLGLDEMFEGFRSLDLRETALPMSLSTEAGCWISALTDALPGQVSERLPSGWAYDVEQAAHDGAQSRHQIFGTDGFPAIPFYSVKMAPHVVRSNLIRKRWEQNGHNAHAEDVNHPFDKEEEKAVARVLELISQLEARKFDVGVSAEHESRRRPFVVLFSRNDPASVVLASVIHSFFYSRYASVAMRDQRPPILYVSDQPESYAPRYLTFGNHTIVVNGLSELPTGEGPGEFYGYKNALTARAAKDSLQYMGVRARIPPLAVRRNTGIRATRWQPGNTATNTQALLAAIAEPDIARVTLFASPIKPDTDFVHSDGPDSNLPLLVALTEAVDGDLCVYDGLFLTAARHPRYLEVREVLDAAEHSAKVYFAGTRAPFTSRLSPAEACEKLRGIEAKMRLTASTRANFFRLLSNLTEAQRHAG